MVQLGELRYQKVYSVIDNLNTNLNVICKVVSNKEENEYVDKYIVEIISCEEKELEKILVIIYVKKDINLEYGDIIKINGFLNNPEMARNKSGFDYSRYLKQEKIYGICKVENLYKIDKKCDLLFYIFKVKNICINIINKNFNKEEAGILRGLLLGDMSFISDEIKEDFQNSNLAHVLAISGMHFTYIISVIDFVFEKIMIPKKIKYFFEIFFITFFVSFSGASVSCVRAGSMMILVIISKIIYRCKDFYSNLMISLIFVLLLNPYNIESSALWLSFLGTLSLVLFNKKIDKGNKIINYILNNVYISFIVQLLIFPIMIYFFNNISLTFFISNLLVSFFIGPLLILGYICLFCRKFKILNIIEKALINIILKIAEVIANMKLSSILIGSIKIYVIIFYYICILIFINRKSIQERLKKINFVKENMNNILLKKINIKIIFLILLVFILMFNFFPFKNQNIQINFIDVGQGDCTLIIVPNKKTILIDGGDNSENFDYGKRVVGPYLLDKNIRKIDYMIVSHFDSDHVGGLFYLVKNFKVENLLIGIQFENNKNLYDMIEIIKNKNINLKVLKKGDRFEFEKNVFMEVLFPIKENEIKENSINNNSLVFKLTLNDIKILFTGDIEIEAEEELVKIYGEKLKCDILKVAHHGSNTSSSEEFINCANPKIALIGVRKK